MPLFIEFLLFGLMLVALLRYSSHHLKVAFCGLLVIICYKAAFTNMSLILHLEHEALLLVNLLGLLVGFELMADHFEKSRLSLKVSAYLPDGWKGPFVLLCLIFTLSVFLDNIAAAMIGASLAIVVFNAKIRVGYLAAIVAASNAGGAGSVVGDTTTTMMWIAGVNWKDVTHAFLPAITALCMFGIPLSIAQHRYQPIVRMRNVVSEDVSADYTRILIVIAMLVGVVVGNIQWGLPALGLWTVIIVTALLRAPSWKKVPHATLNASFLLALVLSASLMPVEELPKASEFTVLVLGFVSAIFDNIPLTKLALDQGGYDWGWLAYAVGFGGSMMWFGSSAGVAVAKDNPDMRNTKLFLRESWPIPVAYVAGFSTLFLLGWHPHAPLP